MLGRALCGSSGYLSAKCAEPWHTSHIDEAKNDNDQDDNGVSVLVSESVGVSIITVVWYFDRPRNNRLRNVVDLMCTTWAVSLDRLFLPNCLSVSFWFPVCDGFLLPFRIVSCDGALSSILLRSAGEFKAQNSPKLWSRGYDTLAELSFRVELS